MSIADWQRGSMLPALLIVLTVALMIRLGFWQLHRAEEKEALLQAFQQGKKTVLNITDATRLETLPRYQHIRLQGHWLSKPVVLLQNRFLGERPGFDVLLLFKPESGPLLLVNQGWMAQPPEKVELPAGEYVVTGRVDEYPRPGFVLGEPFAGEPVEKQLWSSPYVDAQSLSKRLQQAVSARVLLADMPIIPKAKPHWKPATMPPEKHRGYALQWFSMAAVLAGIGLWLLRKKRKQ